MDHSLPAKHQQVIDFLHLEVFKAKSEPKSDAAAAMPITMPVWLTFQGRRVLDQNVMGGQLCRGWRGWGIYIAKKKCA